MSLCREAILRVFTTRAEFSIKAWKGSSQLKKLISEPEDKLIYSLIFYTFFSKQNSEGSMLDLAAVTWGCCGRMSDSYEKAGENLSLVCGLGRDEQPAARWAESISDERAGQRMASL